jgi:23S rRNA pseudouridine1911/1915/1917 synthase
VTARVDVPRERGGERLDRFLAEQEGVGSRAHAERLIEERRVRVDGEERPKSHRLAPGALVEYPRPEPAAAPPPAPAGELSLAYADEHLLVVDKPAGLLVHPVPGGRGTTLVDLLGPRAGGGPQERPGIVHRLDRDTSGLLVVARHEEAHRRLSALMRERRIERRYLALVRGLPPSRRGTIEAPIGRDRRDRTRISLDSDTPRAAVTHFELEEALPRWSLLGVRLETGRTHQIRVHLAAIGHPVCADPVYGSSPQLGLERQFLHAAALRLPHPLRPGEVVAVESPLPDDLSAALERARAGE